MSTISSGLMWSKGIDTKSLERIDNSLEMSWISWDLVLGLNREQSILKMLSNIRQNNW